MAKKVKKWPEGCDPECQHRTLQALISSFVLLVFLTTYGKYLYVSRHKHQVLLEHVVTPRDVDLSNGEQLNSSHDNAVKVQQSERNIKQKRPTFSTNPCEQETCDLYYIKVHKTGSTTFQNILYRFGLRRDLLIASYYCGNGMPYPNPAYKQFLRGNYSNYDIMCEHAQYDNVSFREYMSRDVKVISLLRHPFEFLQSTIAFHGLASRMGLASIYDVTKAFLGNAALYDKYARFEGSSKECGPYRNPSYTRNAIAHHFGLSYPGESDPEIIKQFLQELDEQITLVLILEKFDESLILLKRSFHWQLSDLIYLPLWSLKYHNKHDVRIKRSKNETDTLIELHKKWSPIDYQLYNHYHSKLNTILDGMPLNFWEEVKVFKLFENKVKAFCASMCYENTNKMLRMTREEALTFLRHHMAVFEATDFNQAFDVTYLDCLAMSQGTVTYQNVIKVKQYPGTFCGKYDLKFNKAFCHESDYVVNRLPWSLVKHSLFETRAGCLKNFGS